MGLNEVEQHEHRSGFAQLGYLDTAQAALGVADRDAAKVEGLGAGIVAIWDLEKDSQSGPVVDMRFSTDADADSTVIDVMAQWGAGGDYVRIFTLTFTGGKQTVGNTTRVWVDTIVVSNSAFEGQVSVTASAADLICRLAMDGWNVSKLAFIATTLQGSSTLRVEGQVMSPRSWWAFGT